MPKLKIQKNSSLNPQEAFSRISNFLENDKELRKLDPNYECEFDDQSLSGTAKGGQFTATLDVSEEAGGSVVEVAVDLPFHLAMVKGMVKKTLEKKLDEQLG